ncbi:MAG: 5'/3'-nucleotidase SurE [Thermoprotei archaeon]|nr:MAG: 5'/3'-nucleotidase SurE [Thermoprotei archaeon]
MILLTNDDGPGSLGLTIAKRALLELDDVVVIVPTREQSCIGKAITSGRVVKVGEARMLDGTLVAVIDGTPADVVLIAFNKLLKQRPRLLVSGINLGPNLGLDDALDSGTLGAAFEAALRGVPAIAMSYCMERGEREELIEEDLEEAGEVLRRVARFVLEEGMPRGVDVLSINVPVGFKLSSTPIELTRLSSKPYRDLHVEVEGGYVIKYWGLDIYGRDVEDTDVEAIRRGALSITPIALRLPSPRKSCRRLLEVLAQ